MGALAASVLSGCASAPSFLSSDAAWFAKPLDAFAPRDWQTTSATRAPLSSRPVAADELLTADGACPGAAAAAVAATEGTSGAPADAVPPSSGAVGLDMSAFLHCEAALAHMAVEAAPAIAMIDDHNIAETVFVDHIGADLADIDVFDTVADAPDHPRRGGQHLHAAPHIDITGNADIDASVLVIDQSAAHEVLGAGSRVMVEIFLHHAVEVDMAIDREGEARRIRRWIGTCRNCCQQQNGSQCQCDGAEMPKKR